MMIRACDVCRSQDDVKEYVLETDVARRKDRSDVDVQFDLCLSCYCKALVAGVAETASVSVKFDISKAIVRWVAANGNKSK